MLCRHSSLLEREDRRSAKLKVIQKRLRYRKHIYTEINISLVCDRAVVVRHCEGSERKGDSGLSSLGAKNIA